MKKKRKMILKFNSKVGSSYDNVKHLNFTVRRLESAKVVGNWVYLLLKIYNIRLGTGPKVSYPSVSSFFASKITLLPEK